MLVQFSSWREASEALKVSDIILEAVRGEQGGGPGGVDVGWTGAVHVAVLHQVELRSQTLSVSQSTFPFIQTIASVNVSAGVGPFFVAVRGNPQFWFRVARKMKTEK